MKKALALVSLLTLTCVAAQAQTISTVAGGGPNNLPAVSANLPNPISLAEDSVGNFFIADCDNNRIFKVDTSGQLTVVAGNGLNGFSGNGGPATSAELNCPEGVAVDASGNVFIPDHSNVVWEVFASGPMAGNIAIIVNSSGASGHGGDGGPATSALLNNPLKVAVDSSGNLFIVDASNQVVREVFCTNSNISCTPPAGFTANSINTVAGNFAAGAGFSGDGGPATSAQLNFPDGVAVDSAGNLFISDTGNFRVRKVNTSGVITTVAGNGTQGFSGDGGPATSAELNQEGVATDSAGNLFIADGGNNVVREVFAAGPMAGNITTVAGNFAAGAGFSGDGGPATSAQLNDPRGVVIDSSGDLFIADNSNLRVREVAASNGNISSVAGNGLCCISGDGGPAINAALNEPASVTVDTSSNLIIADRDNDIIRKVDTTGTITTVAGNGTRGFSGDGGPATSAELHRPFSAAVDGSGNIFISDTGNKRIRKVDTTGTITTVAGTGTAGFSGDGGPATSAEIDPGGVGFDASGNLLIVDTFNNRIRKVDTTGTITTVAGNGTFGFSGDGGPATSAALACPFSVAVDGSGNLFIADASNNRIRKVDTTGTITTVAGNGTAGFSGDGGPATSAELNFPRAVAFDASGNLLIADRDNERVRKVDTSGTITTLAGNGVEGFGGDGGPATSAELDDPLGVALDPSGNLFITDRDNNRIREVSSGVVAAPAVTLSATSLAFGNQNVGTTSAAQTVTLTNSGTATLTITSITITGTNSSEFTQTNTCGASVNAGQPCTISVTFTPTATGSQSATLVITDNAANSPQSVSVSGSGGDFSFVAAAGSSTTQTVTAGGTATYMLQVISAGGFAGAVTLTCTGAPAQATCNVPASVTAPASFTATVTTMARGMAPPAPLRLVPPAIKSPQILLWLALLLFVAAWFAAKKWLATAGRGNRRRWLLTAAPLAAIFLAFLFTSGCGQTLRIPAPPTPTGTPAGTYTVTITGASGGATRSIALTLVVQ